MNVRTNWNTLILSLMAFLMPGVSSAFCQADSTRAFERGRSLFRTNCAPCHGVHKARTGPMLASITKKRSKEWLHNFIRNSQEVIISGDAYAGYLFESFNQQVMPAFKEMPDSLIATILYYIEKESMRPGADQTHAAVRKFSSPGVLRGKQIFANQCASCHSIDKEDYGPALGSVGKRLPESWLVAFIRNSQEVIQRGDPYAVNMFEEYDKKVMVPMEFLTREDIRAVLAYIEFESSSTHPVAGVNGRPLRPERHNESLSGPVQADSGAEEESSFKAPFMVLSIMAAIIHGYLIVMLFRYLNRGQRRHI